MLDIYSQIKDKEIAEVFCLFERHLPYIRSSDNTSTSLSDRLAP